MKRHILPLVPALSSYEDNQLSANRHSLKWILAPLGYLFNSMICAVASWILLRSLDYPSLRSSLCVGLLAHRHYDSVSLSEARLNLFLWKKYSYSSSTFSLLTLFYTMDWVVSSVCRLGLGNPKYYRVGNIKINRYW